MKKLAILIALLGFYFSSSAQEIQLKLRFLNTQLKPIKHTKVKLVEVETREELVGKTDGNGAVSFQIKTGKLWQINFQKIKNYPMWRVKMPPRGIVTQKRTFTYDLEKYRWELSPPVDRSTIELKTVQATASENTKPTKEMAVGRVVLKRKSGTPLQNFLVRLFSKKTSTLYESKTNSQGVAYFSLPLDDLYDVELEDIERFSYLKIPNHSGSFYRSLTFEPRNFEESKNENIITQQLPDNISPTSARHLVTVLYKVKGKGPMTNTKVHLKDERDLEYQTKTDQYGVAKYMLPKGFTYFYVTNSSGILEERVEVIDLKYAFGIGSMNKTVIIDPALSPRESVVKFALPKTTDAFNQFWGDNGLEIISFKNLSVPYYAKSYLCYEDPDNAVGIKKGLLMTTGSVFRAIGPNDLPGASQQNSLYIVEDIPKDLRPKKEKDSNNNNDEFAEETALGFGAYDVCQVIFEVKPTGNKLNFEYVFASEEYPEYLNFDDAFGIFVSKKGQVSETNLAKINQDNVSVSYVNEKSHNNYYWANDKEDKPSFKNWQYDGFTKKMTRSIEVQKGGTYEIKLIIFDRRDGIYDSGVFINFWSE